MTYTVIARCERTGEVGIACATYTLAVGQYCDGLVPRGGITMSQASVRQVNNAIAAPMLAQGAAAKEVLAKLLELDNHVTYRQIGVIDARGDCAVHTGGDARDWKGHRSGQGFIAMGNVLLGPQVVDAMAQAYVAHSGLDLEDRLLLALEAGRDAGGQSNGVRRMPERSSALIVMGAQAYPRISLRVDADTKAVDALRALHTRYKKYEDYYRQRDLFPHTVPGQEVFEESFGGQTLHTP
ncbi:MAG: DUF1028 domain-containing protein [Ramlibacter sp.]|nr:DUF1028 domain-containing protein [Ramlibacter sp.]